MIRRIELALAMIGAIAGVVCAAEYTRGPVPAAGETFRASFENGPRADLGAGFPEMHARVGRFGGIEGWTFDFVKGRVGRALDLGPARESLEAPKRRIAWSGEEASFKAQGQLCLRVGTISLWCRAEKGGPSIKVTSQTNDNHTPPILLLDARAGGDNALVRCMDRTYTQVKFSLPGATLSPGQWHHVALVWDERHGVRVYLDGDTWGSNWGDGAYQAGYLSAGRLALAGAVFDEVRIFDAALSDARIKSLANGRSPVPSPTASRAPVSAGHRLEHLGWLDAPADHFTTIDGPTLIHRADLDNALAVRRSGWRGVDGREDSVWPLHYHSYYYPDSRGPLRLFLAEGERFNLVRIRGTIDQATLRVSDAFVMPKEAPVLADLAGRRFVTNLHLREPCRGPGVSLYPHQPISTGPSVSDRYYWRNHRELHDLALLHVRPKGVPADPAVLACTLTDRPPESVAGDNCVRLIHWYRPAERRILMGSTDAAPTARAAIRPLEYVHLMAPPQASDLPLSAVGLHLEVDGWKAGNTVNVRVHDPFNLWRALIDVDVKLGRGDVEPEPRAQGAGRSSARSLDLVLEFPPTLLPRDTELWVTLASRDRGQLRCGAGASTLTMYGPEMKKARAAYYTMQHRLLADNFEILSEPHPWSYATRDNEHLRVALARFDAIARIMWDLHRRFPDDRWTNAYVMWTHRSAVNVVKPLWERLPYPKCDDPTAPQWALLEKEISVKQFEFANWWIDNRLTPNGEFGSGTGDDTDMLGDWVSLAMLSDLDGRLRHSHRLLTDFVWHHRMRNGLNAGMSDALHAYEVGNNVQPYAALMDYGNPVLMERLAATARRYDGFLLTPAVHGKRRFAGNAFCDGEVKQIERRTKPNHSRLILHAGLMLMWYNGHPPLTRMMTEVYDGTPPMLKGRTGDLEYALYLVTGDRRFAERCKYPARHLDWCRLLHIRTIAPDALEELAGHVLDLPRKRRPSKRYLAWRYTRDKKHLVYALRHLYKTIYYMFDMLTRTGQSGDRVHLHWLGSQGFTDSMYFGGCPGARNRLIPLHAVSYEGLTPRFAGLVLEDTPKTLRWLGFNFEERPQAGMLRVWRLLPGTYRVRMGADGDGDGRIDGPASTLALDLKRYEPIPVTLPSRRQYVVEADLVQRDPVPLYDRCDLAVTHEDAARKGRALTVVVHNLGCRPTGAFEVRVADTTGRVLAARRHPGLDGIADLQDKKAPFTFTNMPAAGDLLVRVRGPEKEITEVNNVATLGPRAAPK